VSATLQKLQGCTSRSIEEGNIVHASIERLKTIKEQRVGGPTKFTTWGDIDHMLQRTIHYTKDRSGKTYWSLEVEEGWMPYKLFSASLFRGE
jgi:hypothetical protein